MLKSVSLFSLLSLLTFMNLSAQTVAEWIRWPSISKDGKHIVFTYKGNLFTVPTEGGEAKQLTFHPAHDFRAIWSPDGQHIAFASDRYGNMDIYMMPSAGGEATRLTYHSNDEHPYSFSPDGELIHFGGVRQDAAEHRQFPTGSQHELYSVPASGGRVTQVATVPMEEVQWSNDGKMLLYQDKKGGEDEWRKHHQSSIARDLWSYNPETGEHKQWTSFAGEDRNPVMLEEDAHIYYLSEESGVFNVHRFDSKDPRNRAKLTDFKTHPVRFLSAGGGKLAFSQHGFLYTMVPGEKANKLEVIIRTQDAQNVVENIPISGGISEMAVSPNGKEIAVVVRGEVFVTSVNGALTKRVTDTPWEEAHLSWGKEGKELYYAGEREGKWSIYKSSIISEEEPFFYAASLLEEKPVLEGKADHYQPNISPDGKYIAWIENRVNLKVKPLDGGNAVTLLDENDMYTFRDGDQYFQWSPDSKWLLVDYGKSLSNSEVMLISRDGKKRENLTNSAYYDRMPMFAEGGKQVLWMSNRYGMKSYATSGRSDYDVFALFLDQARWDDFQLSKEDKELQEELEKAAKEDKKEDEEEKKDQKKEDEVKPIEIDWVGLEDRKARLTQISGSIRSAVLSKDASKLYYIAQYEDESDLWEVDLRERKSSKIIPGMGSGSLQWDTKQENLYLLSSGRISTVDLSAKRTKPVKISADMELDKQAEMQALFEHVWLRTSKIFYHSNFHGVDWPAMKKAYQPKIAHLGNEHEFKEVLSEMLGELNVSHSGARYRGGWLADGDQTASLGLLFDWSYDKEGLKVAEVLEGGPMHKASIEVAEGWILKSIDGERITTDMDWVKLLNRKTDKRTVLVFDDTEGKEHRYVIKPISLGAENRLLYKRWVDANRKEVEEKSKGALGYVHIPGMADEPYRSMYDDMMGRYVDSKGVIVDTRWNGGGDLVADLAMFFTGEPFLTYLTEKKVVGGEPTSRFTRPTLAMLNEAQYSDGHCFASGYTDLDIGTTVGMPVPGTCSFAGWEYLSNGVVWGVVPISAQNQAGEWLENNQTNPDVRVKNMPDIIVKGRDQQLEKAIEVLMEEVK